MLFLEIKKCYNRYMNENNIRKANQRILTLLSVYLNYNDDAIKKDKVKEIEDIGVDEEYAVSTLLAGYLGLDIIDNIDDKYLFDEYIQKMLIKQDIDKYIKNQYYQNIKLKPCKYFSWEIKKDKYYPYQLFVCDDIKKYVNGKIVPQIGYFNEEYSYYAIYQNKRLWMSITPNEINTMQRDIEDAFGDVCTFGLGMGYFAYMCAIKDNVKSVCIVEKDKDVIELFKECILPYFEENAKKKIEIIEDDAFLYAKKNIKKDFIFVDLWHDVSDGKDMYIKMKEIEKKCNNETIWRYWIEKTIKIYL